MELCYRIIGEKNLRKEWLNWSNWKVLDLIKWLWEVGRTNVQLSQKSINIFDFNIFILYKVSKREKRDQISAFSFSPSHSLLSSPFSSSPKFFFAEISAAPHLFLLSRFVSWVFTFVLHVLWDDCWWGSFKSWEMFYFHEFMFIWYGISKIWSCLLVNMKE